MCAVYLNSHLIRFMNTLLNLNLMIKKTVVYQNKFIVFCSFDIQDTKKLDIHQQPTNKPLYLIKLEN